MEAVLKKTTETDRRIALESLSIYQSASRIIKSSHKKGIKIKIEDSDDVITVPKTAFSLFMTILQNMAEGKSISIIPSDSEVSTQQAADMLNVSRPHLVKLLETGQIPFRKVGSHRRILLKDIIEYDKMLEKERGRQLEYLAQQAQELNLGYE